ncbi:hypothetical protein AT6N2_C0158 [Agrobacterium tumefaciens]|nr:hypothetical protein AT6N2_C0158 [Agrobacterium tumefaciens]
MAPRETPRSEHRVAVRCIFRNGLDHVPMFGDLAVGHTENIDDGPAAVTIIFRRMNVQIDQITIRRAAHDPGFRLRIFLEETGEVIDEGRLSIRYHGIVLLVAIDKHRSSLLHLMLVEDRVVELDHQLAIGFFLAEIPLCGFGQQRSGN